MNENFNVEFNCSDRTYFGYLENNNIVLYIFIQEEDLSNKEEISKMIAYEIARNFMLDSSYNIENIKSIIYKTNKMLEREKNNNIFLKFKNASVLLVLSNKENFFVASIGNIRLTQLRNNKPIYITRLDNVAYDLYQKKEIEYEDILTNKYRTVLTNSIGGLDALSINFSGEINLELNDKLIIQGVNAWEKENYSIENEDTVIITVIKLNECLAKKKKGYLKIIYFVIIIIILLFFINNHRINTYTNNINKIKNDLDIYKKNNAVKSIRKEIKNILKEYDDMFNAKFIYIPKKTEIMKVKDMVYIDELKKQLKEYDNTLIEINKARKCIENLEYLKAKEIYEKLKLKNNNLAKDEITNGLNLATEFIKASEKEKLADEHFEKKEYKKAITLYNELKTFYYKQNKNEYIKNILTSKIEMTNKNIEESKTLISMKLLEIDELKKVSLVKSLKNLKDVYKITNDLEDLELLNEINNKIKEIEKEIDFELMNAKTLREEALNYLKNKNYKISLESLVESNIRFRKLELKDEVNENNKTIRKIKAIINSNKKPTIIKVKQNSNKDLELKIIKSIYKSIEKGDELIKLNKFNDALEEYERAKEFSSKVKIPDASIKKLNKKIEYAKKRINSSWW